MIGEGLGEEGAGEVSEDGGSGGAVAEGVEAEEEGEGEEGGLGGEEAEGEGRGGEA